MKELPKNIEESRQQLSEYCNQIYLKGWEYIRLPDIIKEHNRVLKEQSKIRGPVDYSQTDYSPGEGFF